MACALSVRTCSKPTLPDAPLASTKRRACAAGPWLLAEACFAYQQKQMSPHFTYAKTKESHSIRRIPKRQHIQNGKFQESSPSQSLRTIPTTATRTKSLTPPTQQKITQTQSRRREGQIYNCPRQLRPPNAMYRLDVQTAPAIERTTHVEHLGQRSRGTMRKRAGADKLNFSTTKCIQNNAYCCTHNDKFAAAQTIMLTVRSSLLRPAMCSTTH